MDTLKRIAKRIGQCFEGERFYLANAVIGCVIGLVSLFIPDNMLRDVWAMRVVLCLGVAMVTGSMIDAGQQLLIEGEQGTQGGDWL